MRPRLSTPARARALGPVLAALLAANGAAGQGLHPLPPTARPLHTRLALADAVAVVQVEAVETGRLRVRVATRLMGETPEQFEIKRAPSSPPPLEAGDRALLLLRGARPPYLLVDEPRETIRLADEQAEARWSAAVAALLAASDDPPSQARLYVDWLVEGPATLRELAGRGLMDPGAPFQPIPEDVLRQLVAMALDDDQPLDARRAAALMVVRLPRASEALLGRLPDGTGDISVTLTLLALRAGAVQRSPSFEGALQRSLRHPSAELRRGALRIAAQQPDGLSPALAREVARLAAKDEDTGIREEAQRALETKPRP